MGTTVLVSEETRDLLAAAKPVLHASSMDEAIRRLLRLATPDARELFQRNRDQVSAVCRRHGIKRLVAFGSRVRDDRSPGSDLDLVADFPPGTDAFDVMAIQDDLTEAFGCPIDLGSMPPQGSRLHDHIREEGVALVGPAP